MSYTLPPDVEEMVRQRMASGKYASQDELLREALRALAEEEEDLAAVEAALAEWHGGDAGPPLEEVFQTICSKYGISLDEGIPLADHAD
jgi:putative addiction module CopG family antidote